MVWFQIILVENLGFNFLWTNQHKFIGISNIRWILSIGKHVQLVCLEYFLFYNCAISGVFSSFLSTEVHTYININIQVESSLDLSITIIKRFQMLSLFTEEYKKCVLTTFLPNNFWISFKYIWITLWTPLLINLKMHSSSFCTIWSSITRLIKII